MRAMVKKSFGYAYDGVHVQHLEPAKEGGEPNVVDVQDAHFEGLRRTGHLDFAPGDEERRHPPTTSELNAGVADPSGGAANRAFGEIERTGVGRVPTNASPVQGVPVGSDLGVANIVQPAVAPVDPDNFGDLSPEAKAALEASQNPDWRDGEAASTEIPEDWRSLSAQERRALASGLTTESVANKDQADAAIERELAHRGGAQA